MGSVTLKDLAAKLGLSITTVSRALAGYSDVASATRQRVLEAAEEMGYVPTMKFASGFEILEYCQKMAEKFGFYDRCLFHTSVEKTEWSENEKVWTVHTDRGDRMRAKFVILANGILTTPKLARIKGMEKFENNLFLQDKIDTIYEVLEGISKISK